MALSDHTLIAAYPLGSGIADLQDSYDGYSAQNMTFAGDGDLSGLPVADFNSSYYGIDNTLQNGFDTEYSFSMWMKPDTIAHSWLMNNEQHGSYYGTWGVLLQADGQVQLFVRNANGGAYDIARTGVSLVADEWSHVAATWSGTEIKWYVDGALVSTTAASRIPWNSPATLWIGANATKSGVQKYYFDGKMSDLRFWYSELTASDVAELHAAGQVPIDLGMDAKYALDTDGSDSIGSNDGTATGVTFESAGGRSYASFALGDEITTGPTAFLDSMLAGSTNKTLSAWVKIDSYTAGSSQLSVNAPTIMSKGDLAAGYIYFNMGINSGYPSFYWYDGSSGREFKSTTRIDLNTWVHVSLVIDDSNTMTYYINGVATGDNGQVFNGVAFAGGQRISLGAGVTHSGHQSMRFAGDMDDLRVWSRALGDSEIATLHSSTQVLEDGLVAKYALDTDAVDSIGSNDGTATGVTFESAGGRSFADFGAGSYIDLGVSSGFDISGAGDFSVSAWINPDSLSLPFGQIAGSVVAGVSSPANAGWQLAIHQGVLKFRVGGSGAYEDLDYTLPVDVAGSWNHVTATRDGTSVKLYLNGVEVASDTFASVYNTYTASAWHKISIGGYYAYSQWYTGYDGKIDDVRIWNRNLSAIEVESLHLATTVTPSLTDDLVAKYALDTNADDSVGSHNGVVTNATFADGAIDYDGSGDYVTIPYSEDLVPQQNLTVSTWVKIDALGNWYDFFVYANGKSNSVSSSYSLWRMRSNNAQANKIYWRLNTGGSQSDIYSPSAVVVDQWYHVVGTYDGAAMKLYVDGVEVASAAKTGNITRTANEPIYLNNQSVGTAAWSTDPGILGGQMNGQQNDLRIWSRTLSASEISTLHAAGAEASSGGASALIDITYGGQLSGVRAFDHNGSVFCYITEESEAPSVYFGTDLSDFASFEKKTIINELSQPMALDGKPISMSMKSDDGSIYLGTSSGKLYHVAYDAGTNCVAKELHDAAEGVRKVHWDSHRSECLFESDGVIHSVDSSETVSVKHALAAGSMVEDFKAAPAGVAIVFRKADFTFEVMFVEGTNWASPKASSQMIESVRAARDFEYNSDLDMWVAAGSSGQISVATLF